MEWLVQSEHIRAHERSHAFTTSAPRKACCASSLLLHTLEVEDAMRWAMSLSELAKPTAPLISASDDQELNQAKMTNEPQLQHRCAPYENPVC